MASVTYSACPSCRAKGKDSRGDNLVNFPDGGQHCFSCSYHVPAKWTFKLPTKETHGSKVLPADWSRDVPTEGWKWLLQYELPYSYWQDKVGWSEQARRLVIKVGNPKSPAFTIGRFIPRSTPFRQVGEPQLDGTRPPAKWFCWGDSHKHAERLGHLRESSVLVEDVVSAHKVAQVEEAIPLFGTVVHPMHVYALRGTDKPIVLWLDADQAGTVQKKALRLQMLTNRPVSIVHTREDPKSLSLNEIKQVLESVK